MAEPRRGPGLRVLHVVPSFWPAVRYGGPIRTVLALCRAVQAAGVEVEVATTDAEGPDRLEVDTRRPVEVEGLPVRYFRRFGRLDYAFSPALWAHVRAQAGRFDLVHVTSTFSFPSFAAAAAARRAGVPYVVSPRGSLQGWSLRQKRWKKVPYWHLVERRDLEGASAIHATAEDERQAVEAVVRARRVLVIPNGAEPPPALTVARQSARVVFLGRLHVKKGLDVLARAMSLLAASRPDAELVVAGPDDVGEWARIEALIQGLVPRPRMRWLGAVSGSARYELLSSARVFALTSHSENFGQAVLEALSCGTPVVVSRGCPWPQVEVQGAGYWVENEPGLAAAALRRILDADGPTFAAMSESARRLAGDYQWPIIGRTMAAAYAELVRDGGAGGDHLTRAGP